MAFGSPPIRQLARLFAKGGVQGRGVLTSKNPHTTRELADLIREEAYDCLPERQSVPGILLLAAQATAGQGVPLPVLTQARKVRELTPDQAERSYPVHLKAVVTYHDPERRVLYIQDATAGIFVQNTEKVPAMAAGQLVEVDGFSGPGAFVPVVRRPQFKVTGRGPLPVARKVSFSLLSTGRMVSQWVEVSGIVRSATLELGGGVIEIAMADGRLKSNLAAPLYPVWKLWSMRLCASGECAPAASARKGSGWSRDCGSPIWGRCWWMKRRQRILSSAP